MAIADELGKRFAAAAERQLGAQLLDPTIRRSQHADFQWNDALAMAKTLGQKPRDIAAAVVADPDLAELATLEVAGPGFVNITLHDTVISEAVGRMAADDRLGVAPHAPTRVVLDYSGPNIAKELHVGHLRSTVIGDSLARILRFAGHEVIAQNHMGDWGTQFGILIAHLEAIDQASPEIVAELGLDELTSLYREAQTRFASDPEFADRARERVVRLQSGDPETLAVWQQIVDSSMEGVEEIYRDLDIVLGRDAARGESFYNSMLQDVVNDLTAQGLLVEDDGALCAFPEGFTGRDDKRIPLIVQKADGGFGYAATDLAAVRYRVGELRADSILYVVDARQSQHFAMVFAVAQEAGWLPEGVAEHLRFGTILGTDGRPFKTREGEIVSLRALIDEAVSRATELSAARAEVPVEQVDPELAHAIGVGALKYGDLSNDRVNDYVFDWDRMVSLVGNTAPYLQYMYARTMSIATKAGPEWDDARGAPLVLGEPNERELALLLLGFEEAVQLAVEFRQPHRICTYLFELAAEFSRFYENCPILKDDVAADVRRSRLALCRVTAAALAKGLDLLGIAAPERI